MKTNHFGWALAALVTFSSWTISDSPISSGAPAGIIKKSTPPAFAFFKTHRQGKDGATAMWGLVSNNGVTSFVLERTYEDPNDPYSVWDPICAMPSGNGRSFSHRDLNLSPGFISYRVIAMNGNAAVVVSEISTIQIIQH